MKGEVTIGVLGLQGDIEENMTATKDALEHMYLEQNQRLQMLMLQKQITPIIILNLDSIQQSLKKLMV